MTEKMTEQQTRECIDAAIGGDKAALEALLLEVRDGIYNLALRMLGMVPDAEDATQEILVKIITSLSSFQKKSAFRTWVYRIAVNYLLNYKKSILSKNPLSFEIYGNDIRYADVDSVEDVTAGQDREALAVELKMSCTNVLLQCLDAESRCIFILGTMFCIDSRIAGEVLQMTPENYRQKLSRARRSVADFLSEHCSLAGSGICSCGRRVNYAVSQGRIRPEKLEFAALHPLDNTILTEGKEEMEQLDALASTFESFPAYKATVRTKEVVENLVNSRHVQKIQELWEP